MQIHTIKCQQPYFNEVWLGHKKFELRRNDRNYQLGDLVYLQEWNEEKKEYNRYMIKCRITSLLENYAGLENNFCIFGFDIEERITEELPDILGMNITEPEDII